MLRLIALALCLITSAVFATNAELRSFAVAQFRAIAEPLFEQGEATTPHFDAFYTNMVENLPPQQRAERALELAINRYEGAADYVMQHAQSWRTEIERSERLSALLTTALNAPLIEIRMAGFEMHLAQYDLDKSVTEVDRLVERWIDNPEGAGPWALWSIAAIGARGVDREHIFDELTVATYHENIKVRRWAVDALAKFGGTEIIEPLLEIAENDSSPIVRERAFCGLAQSGTLHIQERYDAISGLLDIAQSHQSDQQNKAWSYQALREITNHYDVPDDPISWREALLDAGLL